MPTVQTNYPLRQDAGLPGGAAMSRYSSETAVVETPGGIPFGAAIQRGANDRGCGILDGTKAFLGIARLDRGVSTVGGGGATADRYPQYKPLSYFKSSDGVYVIADAAVVPDAIVRYNTATGRYTSAAASGTVIECTGWVFDTTATAAGQLVIIKR